MFRNEERYAGRKHAMIKNIKDANAFLKIVDQCQGDVMLRSCDGTEEFNLCSGIARYIALGKLCDENGELYEFYVMNNNDEHLFFEFLNDIKN